MQNKVLKKAQNMVKENNESKNTRTAIVQLRWLPQASNLQPAASGPPKRSLTAAEIVQKFLSFVTKE